MITSLLFDYNIEKIVFNGTKKFKNFEFSVEKIYEILNVEKNYRILNTNLQHLYFFLRFIEIKIYIRRVERQKTKHPLIKGRYKMKNYTQSQKSIYEKLENQIKKAIEELENKLAAFSCIDYFPKKDGTQKENFSLNFGLKGVGVYYKDERWGTIENVHPVEISLGYGFRPYEKNGFLVPSSVQIAVKPRYCQETNEYIDNFNACTDTIYFSCSDVTDFLGFSAKDNPEKITAENILKLIKIFWIGRLTERLNLHKKELERLPEFFEKAVEIANYLVTEIGKTSEFSYIHKFFYDNFENKDVYFLCNLENK